MSFEIDAHTYECLVRLMQMEHSMVEGKPIFTYLLKNGVTEDGIGMYFIHNENIPVLLSKAAQVSNNR